MATAPLVLLRHGESEWNASGRFSGWADVALNASGRAEAASIGGLLNELNPEYVFVSRLRRAKETLDICLDAMNITVPAASDGGGAADTVGTVASAAVGVVATTNTNIPIKVCAWELNERHYGGLTGLLKCDILEEHGVEQLKLWRRGYKVRPPPMTPDHPFYASISELHKDIPQEQLPNAESLKDCEARCVAFLQKSILRNSGGGSSSDDGGGGGGGGGSHTANNNSNRGASFKPTLVVAHNNVLRGLVKHLSKMNDAESAVFEVPTGGAIVYDIDADGAVVGARRHLAPGGVAAFQTAASRSLGTYNVYERTLTPTPTPTPAPSPLASPAPAPAPAPAPTSSSTLKLTRKSREVVDTNTTTTTTNANTDATIDTNANTIANNPAA